MSTVLDDGLLQFQIRKPNGTVSEWQADCLELKLVAEDLERKHDLKQIDGCFIPTLEFLKDLSEAYKELGAEDCTPTAAKSVWIAVTAQFIHISSRTEQQLAELLEIDGGNGTGDRPTRWWSRVFGGIGRG